MKWFYDLKIGARLVVAFWRVDWVLHYPGIDWLTFKLVASVSRKEMHV
jgi:hypothetical protein